MHFPLLQAAKIKIQAAKSEEHAVQSERPHCSPFIEGKFANRRQLSDSKQSKMTEKEIPNFLCFSTFPPKLFSLHYSLFINFCIFAPDQLVHLGHAGQNIVVKGRYETLSLSLQILAKFDNTSKDTATGTSALGVLYPIGCINNMLLCRFIICHDVG